MTVRREKLLIQHSIFDGTGLSWKVLATVEATDGNKYQMADPSLTGHRWSFAGGNKNISYKRSVRVH